MADAPGAGEQGFAAVEDDADLGQRVGGGVFGDALGGVVHGRRGHDGGLGPPPLVGGSVDVAVVAGEVTSARDLHDELLKGEGLYRDTTFRDWHRYALTPSVCAG
ncbi:hypothetical protein Ssi02_22430 [Sinosporangium siamense]|uniref:Uncharacterized protein n=1 Tax=Sinosporangium siamense TaxID=1367973 RepID=A0A919V7E8_9ACTN|nr:hypothetical protein Ssi02_22430 [Sinosporangium siamense]